MDLILALKKGDAHRAEAALDRGANPNLSWNNGFHTPLRWTLENHHAPADPLGCAKLLLARGADPNGGPNGPPPLIVALQVPRDAAAADHIRLLLQAGALPDARDRDGQTALMLCAKLNKPGALAALLAGGADPLLANAHGLTALGWAVACGWELPALLLIPVSGPSARDADGFCVAEAAQRALAPHFRHKESAAVAALAVEYAAALSLSAELSELAGTPARRAPKTL